MTLQIHETSLCFLHTFTRSATLTEEAAAHLLRSLRIGRRDLQPWTQFDAFFWLTTSNATPTRYTCV